MSQAPREPRRVEIYEVTDSSDEENKLAISESIEQKFCQNPPPGPSAAPAAPRAAAPPLRPPRILVAGWRFRSGDPSLAATIPLQQALVGPGERHRSEVVEHPLLLYRAGLGEQAWSEQEQRVFAREFRENNFEDIAKALPGKTVKDCVRNYYRNKGRIFELTVKRGVKRMRPMKERKADFDLGKWEEQRGLAME